MITIVDCGAGNIGSIVNMLNYLGIPSCVAEDKLQIAGADKLILPGVGAFDYGMDCLKKLDLIGPLNEAVQERKVPILGICLGMQLLCDGSDEGKSVGLGWIKGKAKRFDLSYSPENLRVPHMGWSELKLLRESRLFSNSDRQNRFYFVHSYHVCCDDPEDVVGTVSHGSDVTAVIEKSNVFGAQFHPEKSHRYGMQLFNSFARLSIE
ncbi:imidazole glycerol phosphate synthase subunit HisH [Thalassospira australica]|uniref:imidazole glycerol phosphate synthase subunit HisH n=1 Tax=Thalassospira australica TaxID=1528106 RepID=UPI00051A3395|nr:imidazole glycerol phosphate synthase subunit HisH [Thalassospira australica]